jgi:hypothetical protein
MSLIHSVNTVGQLDEYLDSDHNYTHQGLYKIVEYYNNLDYDTYLHEVSIRSTFLEYEMNDIIIEYKIPEQTFNDDDEIMSLNEYIVDWLMTYDYFIDNAWYLPFSETFLIKLRSA